MIYNMQCVLRYLNYVFVEFQIYDSSNLLGPFYMKLMYFAIIDVQFAKNANNLLIEVTHFPIESPPIL